MSNRRRRTAPIRVGTYRAPDGSHPETFWNGQPTPARRCQVLVGDTDAFPEYWARKEGLVGRWIPAVEVTYGGHTSYLDDRDGGGWFKVTSGMGSPRYGHSNIEAAEVRPR